MAEDHAGSFHFRYEGRPRGRACIWYSLGDSPEVGPIELTVEQADELGRLMEAASNLLERVQAPATRGSLDTESMPPGHSFMRLQKP